MKEWIIVIVKLDVSLAGEWNGIDGVLYERRKIFLLCVCVCVSGTLLLFSVARLNELDVWKIFNTLLLRIHLHIRIRHAWAIYNKFFEWKFIIWPLLFLLVLWYNMDVCCSSRLSFLCCVMIANLNHFVPQEILCHYIVGRVMCGVCIHTTHISFSLFFCSFLCRHD